MGRPHVMAAVWLVAVTAAPASAAKKALHDIPLVWKPGSCKAENHYETLSDSLAVAAFNLLKEDGFRKALTATSAPASVNGGR